MNAKTKGYALGAIAAATYGMNPLFALPLYKAGMNPDSALFFRYIFAIPILASMIFFRGRSFKIESKDLLLTMIMGLLMAISSLTLFESYNYMEAGIASTILFVYPIMVALIMIFVFKEKISLTTILCIAMAFSGISLLYQGGGEGGSLSLVGTLLVIASALSYAIYIVAVNQTRLKNVATLTITFYVIVFGSLLFFYRVGFGTKLILPSSPLLWLDALALAVFPTAISFLCTTRAIHYIGSTPAAILGALEPVTAVAIGITIFGESLSFTDIVGIIIIVLAVTLVIAENKITPQLVRFRKLFPRIKRKVKGI